MKLKLPVGGSKSLLIGESQNSAVAVFGIIFVVEIAQKKTGNMVSKT